MPAKSFSVFFHLWGNGGPNWHRGFSLWIKEREAEWTVVGSKSKKSYAKAVCSPLVSKKTPFLHLKYHGNHYDNYVLPLPHSKSRDAQASNPARFVPRSAPVVHAKPKHATPKRVRRWVPKSNLFEKACSKEKTVANDDPSRPGIKAFNLKISNSNPKAQASGSKPSPSPRLAHDERNGLHYSKCLCLGHRRKECKGMVRCTLCFNYGHVSCFCLSKNQAKRCFRPISRPKGEESRNQHLYPGDGAPLESSTPNSHRHSTHSRKPQCPSHGELALRPGSSPTGWLHHRGTSRPLWFASRGLHHRVLHSGQ